MTDFKLAGIVSAVGLGLGYLLGGRSSKVMEAVQGDYAITYLESHDEAKNQHKYYLFLTSGNDNYTAYGRLPGYGKYRGTMKLEKQPSASKMKELAMKKMKTYQLVGHKYDQIPSELRAELERKIGMKSSSPSAEPKQEEKNPSAGINARQRIFMKRRGLKKNAETFEANGFAGRWKDGSLRLIYEDADDDTVIQFFVRKNNAGSYDVVLNDNLINDERLKPMKDSSLGDSYWIIGKIRRDRRGWKIIVPVLSENTITWQNDPYHSEGHRMLESHRENLYRAVDSIMWWFREQDGGLDFYNWVKSSSEAETFEARGHEPNKPYYATAHADRPTSVMHPIKCGHYKMVMDGTGVWMSPTFYDTIEEMVEDQLHDLADAILADSDNAELIEQYKNLKTVGEARKWLSKTTGTKLNFAPCFKKEYDYDSKALNALPITPIFDWFDAETFEANDMGAEGLNFSTNCLNCGNQYQVMDKKDHVKLVCYDCSDYIKLPKSHLSDSNKRELIMIQEGFKENEKNEAFHKKYPHGMMAESFEADMSVGNEMLRQLGGRRFMMMVGAKQPIWDSDKNELHMKIGRNALGANYFVIRLNPRDLYDLRFESRRMNRKTYEMSVKVKAEYDDVYADQLQDIFEQATGLYVRMAESFEAEYQPDQELGDYAVSEIAKSSAIEGYQPNKYSFGPIGYGAEMKLKKDSCCCGATKKHPCLCMIKGTKQCSAKSPMCPCYKEIAMGTKVEMEHTDSKEEAEKIAKEHLAEHPDYYSRLKKAGLNAETFEAKDGKRMYCPNCKTNRTWNSGFKKQNLDYSKGERPRDFIFYVCQKCNYAYDPKTSKEIVGDWRKMFGYDAESNDSIPKPNPADKEEAFAWVKREHPHIKTDADREMEGVDYAAMTYHPEELEAGAINALKAGDFEAAERFVKALNRQNFIKAFQAEKNG